MEQLILPLSHNSDDLENELLFSSFHRFIVEWISYWPEWNRSLVIYGGVGCGKTGLINFLANQHNFIIVNNLDTNLIYNDIINKFAGIIIDDAQNHDEEKLLFLLNIVKEFNKRLIITSLKPPSYWKINMPDLASRLRSIPLLKIDHPDEEIIKGCLEQLLIKRQLTVSYSIIDFISSRIKDNLLSVKNMIKIIDDIALKEHRNITLSFVKKVFSKYNNMRSE